MAWGAPGAARRVHFTVNDHYLSEFCMAECTESVRDVVKVVVRSRSFMRMPRWYTASCVKVVTAREWVASRDVHGISRISKFL